jgi:hypothetical protein
MPLENLLSHPLLAPAEIITNEFYAPPNSCLSLEMRIDFFLKALKIAKEMENCQDPYEIIFKLNEAECSLFLIAAVLEFLGYEVGYFGRTIRIK